MSTFSLTDAESCERYAALAGCTLAQLKHAIECVGDEEHRVRDFLEQNGLIREQHPVVLGAAALAADLGNHADSA